MSERIWRGTKVELRHQEADAGGILPTGFDAKLPPLEMEWRVGLYRDGVEVTSAQYTGAATDAGDVTDEELEEMFGGHPALDASGSN